MKYTLNKKEYLKFIYEKRELKSQIDSCYSEGSKINAIKALRLWCEYKGYETCGLRDAKDTIDVYYFRIRITKKLKELRERIEKWANKNGYENIKKRREVKSKNGDYIYLYTDWELVDDHVGLMINDYEWLPSKKEFREYNLLWKNYSNVRNLV